MQKGKRGKIFHKSCQSLGTLNRIAVIAQYVPSESVIPQTKKKTSRDFFRLFVAANSYTF